MYGGDGRLMHTHILDCYLENPPKCQFSRHTCRIHMLFV